MSLATACSMGLGANDVLLNAIARETRQVVAGILEQSLQSDSDTDSNSTTTLVVTGKRLVTARAVLRQAARECQLDEKDYLQRLRLTGQEGGLYGGGPELTVLTNVLRRPISIYELLERSSSVVEQDAQAQIQQQQQQQVQPIVCKGIFGASVFADPLRHVPNSAVVNAALQLQGAYSWHLHILVVDSGNGDNEKHACVLLPQNPAVVID